MTSTLSAEIAATAARLIVEEGLEYGAAKRRAARDLGATGRSSVLPGNDQIEDEVRAYISLYHADSQPAELAALRDLAATWMERLAAFRPHLTGAVWRGTATHLNDIHIELYCDDPKAAELALIDQRVDYEVSSGESARGRQIWSFSRIGWTETTWRLNFSSDSSNPAATPTSCDRCRIGMP